MRARAVILDMDGLMVDSEPHWFGVEREFARRRGGDWTEALAHACIGQGLARTLAAMHEAFGIAIDPARDAEEIFDLFIAGVTALALKPGCAELVAACEAEKVPIAVASSSAGRLVRAVMERFDLTARMNAIVTGDDVARPKPAPDIFLVAAERLGAPPAECVVLEDSFAGATAGRAAGMRVIAVPERADPRFAGTADAIAKDLYEARALLVLR